MRINRSSLLRVIRNTVTQRTRNNPNLLSIYLGGSLLGNDYALGGAVDIDLFFVHAGAVEQGREIVRMTDEVHLDIAHHEQRAYRQPKALRLDPWMGANIKTCEIYYDPGHFMDFTQASVRGQFDHPDNVLVRVRKQAEEARQIWFKYEMEIPRPGPKEIGDYLRSLWNAGNAVASLSGSPLTERRYLLQYPQRAQAVGRPGLTAGFLGLLGAQNVEVETIRGWLQTWATAYDALPADRSPASLHPDRKFYYLLAFEEILDGEQPMAALWPLLNTWTRITNNLPGDKTVNETWQGVFQQLGLLDSGFGERIEALDAYLDLVEETIDSWARRQGVEQGTY